MYRLVYGKEFCRDKTVSLDDEEWKELEGSNGKYYVSNLGRLKSCVSYDAYILHPFTGKRGYQRVSLWLDGQRKDYYVHRLVMMCFAESPAQADYQIHHIDFDTSNNCRSNLEYLSPLDHRKKHIERNKKDNGKEHNQD